MRDKQLYCVQGTVPLILGVTKIKSDHHRQEHSYCKRVVHKWML
jgi:hypothetical protein